MTDYPLLDAIDYPLAIYKQCHLQEIIAIGCGMLTVSVLFFPLLTGLFCHSASVGLAIALPGSFALTRWGIGRLARLKHNKPVGFDRQRLHHVLSQTGLYTSPVITRVGRWSIGRR